MLVPARKSQTLTYVSSSRAPDGLRRNEREKVGLRSPGLPPWLPTLTPPGHPILKHGSARQRVTFRTCGSRCADVCRMRDGRLQNEAAQVAVLGDVARRWCT